MSIETKLREGAQAIKQATRQAEFTSRSPATRRQGSGGPMLALVAGLTIIALVAIPALLTGVGGKPSGGVEVGAAPAAPSPSAEQPTASTAEPQLAAFPHLVLDLPDTEMVDAYEIIDDVTGNRIGTHQVYHMTYADDRGREILLRVQEPGTEFWALDHYGPLAEATEAVTVDQREVTVHLVPDEAIEEGAYDQGMLQWTEAPGYEVILIPWGLDKDEALVLMDGLTTIDESQWEKLRGSKDEPSVTTTIVESETSTTGAVEAPENSGPDGP